MQPLFSRGRRLLLHDIPSTQRQAGLGTQEWLDECVVNIPLMKNIWRVGSRAACRDNIVSV